MALRRWALLAVLGTGLTAACTAAQPGPETSTVVKEWTRVGSPKSVDKDFRVTPCETLTEAERRDLGLPSPPTASAQADPAGCTWRDQDSGTAVLVELDPLSLAQRYDREPGSAGVSVVKVAGYPAVRAQEGGDGRGCEFRIGVSATEALHVAFSAPKAVPDACGSAQRVAEAVIGKLPAGS
ncbi:DUF3558 domain-containing protein [Crossiella sp. NPDC003009]